ncbi:MAG: cytochrome C oxidase subunit IV family protein [Bacteroidota bacterium]|nr:cytochrome C oxidase subunit IV family protein [Bacteroidota bacterium]
MDMNTAELHITSYKTLAGVLIMLLLLTTITINVTSFDLRLWNVTIALMIAGGKGYLVMTYFMHLKYENKIIRAFVMVVLLLFLVIFGITFIDYLYR